MPFRALIFDFDGTILDTETPDLIAWREIFDEHGGALDHAFWCQFVGRHGGMEQVLDHLEQQTRLRLPREAILQQRRDRCMEIIHRQGPRPGVAAWLRQAEELGLRCAIASSSSGIWVEGHLERLELRRHFSAIRCRDHVSQTKPHPEVYLAAIEALGVGADEALAIEDSPHGVTAAKAAGVRCIAVPNEVTRSLPFEHADMVVETLDAVTILEALKDLT